MSIELEGATIEDMVAELERRGITAAIVVSHVQGMQNQFSPERAPADREKVYGNTHLEKHPGYKAGFLCRAIQWCLTDASDHYNADASITLELSRTVNEVSTYLTHLFPE